MRTAYQEQLSALTEQVAEMCGLAGVAMDHASQALLHADLELAEQVISEYAAIAAMSFGAAEDAFVLLALQAPVAGDLRTVVGFIQIAADVDRMGALALHVAKIARRRHPEHAVPEEVNGYFAEIGRVAVELGNGARAVLLSRDAEARLVSTKKTTRWTSCTAIYLMYSRTISGNTAWQLPST
jgi:phosphate transport system protein